MRGTATAFALVLALFAAVGCGGGGSSSSDPATIVPRSAFFYGEAVIDPDGGQETAVRSIIGKFPGEGPPEQRLEKLIAKAIRESDEGNVDYEKDVKPWLGDKVALFASPGAAGSKPGATTAAVVIPTDDEDAAMKAIQKLGDKDLTKRSYKGVEYWRDPDEDEINAGGIVDGFAVTGTEGGFKAAVDASKGETLSESDRYTKAIDGAADERVGLMYVDIQGAFNSISRQQQLGIQGALLGGAVGQIFGDKPLVATVTAENDGVVVDSSFSGGGGILLSLFGEGTEIVGELPPDSWAAGGQPELGKTLTKLVDTFAGLAGGKDQIKAQVQRQTGLDLDRDILGWIGDVGYFVQGTTKADLGGGVVIETTDEAASKRALAAVQRLIQQEEDAATVKPVTGGFVVSDAETPQGVYFLQKGERVVIAYGKASADGATAGGGGLSENPTFQAAQEKLGDGFEASLFVAMAPVLEVARNFGADEAKLAMAEPYLKVFDHIVAGSKKDGDKLKSRTRIGLK